MSDTMAHERPKARFDMMLTAAECVTCKASLSRGMLIRLRPINGTRGCAPQCASCAATELLPLIEAHDAKVRARYIAEGAA